ncbi:MULTISPECIES: 3' terminal RNA ribose 2'-O-methyltransferase Hen1 [unclassified Mycolicibacterium]|uniref:3' terminal RNA ribose 2'-O-methyltransferase Hen1 n=1 Tax=unclassified Mycolicibacterium TaxID=2636767 RepID=UPI002ED81AB3
MYLTVSTTHRPATDLGYLLHKHPDRAQRFEVAGGVAHVFYPQATDARCTAALFCDIDPVNLVRGKHNTAFSLGQYVNDRPYAAGSLLAVAMGTVFKSAMKGVSAKQDLADTAIPLEVGMPALPGGAALVRDLFTPLGWQVAARTQPLDAAFPEWGESPYTDVRLTGTLRLSDALNHLYVLLPVLDDAKHYWVGEAEVDKLLRAGEGWLDTHPLREVISRRYLRHRREYVDAALARLCDGAPAEDQGTRVASESLAVQRRRRVVELLTDLGATRVVDLGCGAGALVRELVSHPRFTEILGVDVSAAALDAAARSFEHAGDRVRDRVTLRQSALTYADPSLAGYDAAVLMEVIEHIDENRLPALHYAVFGVARPRAVVVTTPNAEYNVRFDALPAGQFRHPDHRFEWNRAEFGRWAAAVADRYGYTVRFEPIEPQDPDLGPPTQVAVFEVTA